MRELGGSPKTRGFLEKMCSENVTPNRRLPLRNENKTIWESGTRREPIEFLLQEPLPIRVAENDASFLEQRQFLA